VTKIANGDTHESEFSLSVSDSSLRCDFHFLYLSIRSIRYEFFFAFLINWNFSSSFAVGLCARTQKSQRLQINRSLSFIFISLSLILRINSSLFPCYLLSDNSFYQFQLYDRLESTGLHNNIRSVQLQRIKTEKQLMYVLTFSGSLLRQASTNSLNCFV